MSEKIVNVEKAEVASMTVQIAALRVGNRQVTQSVFRQLPLRFLFKDGEPQGEPWGFVTYRWKGDGCRPLTPGCDNVQLVWQYAKHLCRCPWPDSFLPDNYAVVHQKIVRVPQISLGEDFAYRLSTWLDTVGLRSSFFRTGEADWDGLDRDWQGLSAAINEVLESVKRFTGTDNGQLFIAT